MLLVETVVMERQEDQEKEALIVEVVELEAQVARVVLQL
jgi:hypothetical protein